MTRFSDLPDFVLGPLAGRSDADWYRAPAGKWNAAQIVEHLALALDWSGNGFEERRARDPMVRRPRTVPQRIGYGVVLRFGWIPPLLEAPSRARPAPEVRRQVAEDHFRRAHVHNLELARVLLPARGHDLFVKHPRMGDLTLEEWFDFHVIHARHHLRQVRARMGP